MSARVLVVDDLLPNVKLLEAKLTSEYFDVLTANDGPSALEIIEAHPPDIVLLDIMMPGMDGFEVCSRIKANPQTMHIPVVMVTALSGAADRVRGIECGADDFLTKPVNDMALFARVRSLVRLKMMMDEWRLREQTSDQLGAMTDDRPIAAEDATNAHILILDDNAVASSQAAETLKSDNNTAEIVSSVEAAYSSAVDGKFDLIIVNLDLADQDALRLCSHLRSTEKTRQIPILLVVEEDEIERLAKGFDLGINDYLIKPIDPNELLARARTQIRRWRYQGRLRSNYERSIEMALTDSLTGLYNRRYLIAHLEGQFQRMQVSEKPLSLMMFDIDFFKDVNDTHGHGVGDEVLCGLAVSVTKNLRNFDTVSRYGGEEFIVVMPDTDLGIAMTVAERLREHIAANPFKVSGPAGAVSITLSIGVTQALGPDDTIEALIGRADEALYHGKRTGRNKAIVWTTSGMVDIAHPHTRDAATS
ncbi:MAG: PleD family two-component system response regulator [Alphaproteobacteria bacterium]|nr:PleD family two-component system response regulator [Alphaproteobacteria bacterium]